MKKKREPKISKEIDAEKRSKLELEILYRISQAMAHRHDVTTLLNEVLDVMETEMGLSRGTLTLRRPDTDIFMIEASRGLSLQEKKRGQYRLGEGITGRVAKTGKPALVPDITRERDFLNRTKSRKNIKVAFLCVPIIHHQRIIGTMSIDREVADEKDLKRISTAAINMMMAYHWPGNVRELENCIERAVLISTDQVIHGYNLTPSLQTSDQTNTSLLPPEGASLKMMMDSYERELIIDALKKHRGNVSAVARELRTTQRIINYRIKNLSINSQNYK